MFDCDFSEQWKGSCGFLIALLKTLLNKEEDFGQDGEVDEDDEDEDEEDDGMRSFFDVSMSISWRVIVN